MTHVKIAIAVGRLFGLHNHPRDGLRGAGAALFHLANASERSGVAGISRRSSSSSSCHRQSPTCFPGSIHNGADRSIGAANVSTLLRPYPGDHPFASPDQSIQLRFVLGTASESTVGGSPAIGSAAVHGDGTLWQLGDGRICLRTDRIHGPCSSPAAG